MDDKPRLPGNYRHSSFHPPETPLIRKRSLAVPLVALGAVAVSGVLVFGGSNVQRNSYSSPEDCERDYSASQCTRDQSVGGYGGYHYYGPWYRDDWRNGPLKNDPGPGRTLALGRNSAGRGPTGLDFGERGGFGSSGRVFARGG